MTSHIKKCVSFRATDSKDTPHSIFHSNSVEILSMRFWNGLRTNFPIWKLISEHSFYTFINTIKWSNKNWISELGIPGGWKARAIPPFIIIYNKNCTFVYKRHLHLKKVLQFHIKFLKSFIQETYYLFLGFPGRKWTLKY